MHVYWFHLIVQMAKALLVESAIDKDIRSEPEYSPHQYDENTEDSQPFTAGGDTHNEYAPSQYSQDPMRKRVY